MPFVAGRSGNPGGRAKGFAAKARELAREIEDQTDDCRELVTFALRVMRDEEAPLRDRMEAYKSLLDRALGKPLSTVELHATTSASTALPDDFDSLPRERQVEVLASIRSRALLASGDK